MKLKPIADRAYSVKPARCPITGDKGFTLWNQFEYRTEDWFDTRAEAKKACDEANADE